MGVPIVTKQAGKNSSFSLLCPLAIDILQQDIYGGIVWNTEEQFSNHQELYLSYF